MTEVRDCQPAQIGTAPSPAPHDEAEALFPEARARRRRRRLLVVVAFLAGCLVVGGVAAAGGFSGPGGGGISTASKPSKPVALENVPRATAQTVALPVKLTSAMLVSGDGSLVVVGSVGASRRCEMVRLNTSTLRESSFVVPACGTWATWSGRSVLLVVDQYVKGTNDEQLRIERVNPRNGTAVLGPAVMPLVGSQIAHVGYAYGDDSLWIAGNTPEGSLLVQVSPATGQLLQQWVLPVGFDTAVLTADDDGAWFSSTPEGASNPGLYHVVAGNPTVTKVNDLTGTIGTSWLQAQGNEVVALLTPPLQSTGKLPSPPNFIARLGQGGTTALLSPAPTLSGASTPGVATQGDLVSLDPQYPGCTTALLNQITPATGEIRAVTHFRSDENVCDASGGSSNLVAAAGQWIFVLKNWYGTYYGDQLVRVRP